MAERLLQVWTGQCQCGAVRYRAQGRLAAVFACHCLDCQKQSASAFGMALWIDEGEIAWERAAPKVWERVMPSGRKMQCSFCADCGSRLLHVTEGAGRRISIKPGTLDDTSQLVPSAHLWTQRQQAWLQLNEEAVCFEANPPALQALLDAQASMSRDDA